MTSPIVRLALALALVSGGPAVAAKTPRDVLVMAFAFDDVITLDPAEIFEFSGAEYAGNTYDRLVGYDPDDVSRIFGVAAESWTISADGRTYTFKMRPGLTFASGNPMTARDAAFSLQRVVRLDKSPAFILTQFGLDAENVEDRIRAVDDTTLVIRTDRPYAPSFLLYCLTATVGSVVDREEVLAHEVDGDLGHAWLRTHHAGGGPFKLRRWKANEVLMLDRNDRYRGAAPAMRQVIMRHVPEPGVQRLLLEKGDVDIARNLGPDQLAGLEGNPEVRIRQGVKGGLTYLGLNQKNAYLAKPEVRQALKYLVDYRAIARTILAGQAAVHQAFLPRGFLGALDETPFALDVARAKDLLARAGLPGGFKVTMDVRNVARTMALAQSIQATFAEAGVELEILPADAKQALTKYRARRHDVYLGRWGPDYQDPHTNADTFARNPDNSDQARAKPLAWRNAWAIPEMTQRVEAALLEQDPARRAQMYLELQRAHQRTSPFVIMFQDIEVIAERADTRGFVIGPAFDANRYAGVVKD